MNPGPVPARTAPFTANVFNVCAGRIAVRVIFAHQFLTDEPPLTGSTIVLNHADARELADLLLLSLKEAAAL